MLHAMIVMFLIILCVALHPIWGVHHLGFGPFFGALAILIVVCVFRALKII